VAIIKKKQMKELGTADAKKRLAELRLDLAKDRAQIAVGGSPPNPGKTREKKRTIAKLLTLISTKKKEVGKTA